jgi:hypothetical protein
LRWKTWCWVVVCVVEVSSRCDYARGKVLEKVLFVVEEK